MASADAEFEKVNCPVVRTGLALPVTLNVCEPIPELIIPCVLKFKLEPGSIVNVYQVESNWKDCTVIWPLVKHGVLLIDALKVASSF